MICGIEEETCEHLFFRCPISMLVCHDIMDWLGITYTTQESLYFSWKKWRRKHKSKKQQKIRYATLTALVYHICRNRNLVLWNDVVQSPIWIIKQVQRDICRRVNSCVEL